MGALQSLIKSPKLTTQLNSPLLNPNRRIELDTSGHPSADTDYRTTPTSHRAINGKPSFLDLPPELRNNIYSHLLTFPNTYIRLMRNKPTKVPALTLLRTCKQVHKEAASVFYAANSFYHLVELQSSTFLGRADAKADKIACAPWEPVWPAARYQRYVTRMIVDVHIAIPWLRGESECNRDVFSNREVSERQQTIREEERLCKAAFIRFYENLETLWGKEKQRSWTGKMVCSGDRWSATRTPRSRTEMSVPARLYCMVAFSEDDEVGAKRMLRNC